MSPSQSRKIVILDSGTIPEEIEIPSFSFPHEISQFKFTKPEEVGGRIADADIVITNKVRVGGEALKKAEKLKLIVVAATGVDVIDIPLAKERGIAVSNIRNYAINTVPEHTFALILALRRSIIAYHQSVKEGRWQESGQFCFFDHPINDLAGSTLGIIGDGVIGKSVADIAKAFGMRVLMSAYKGTTGMGPLYTPFDEVLRQSDIISLHLPLLESTRNLIGAQEFAAMERRPLLINTARGGLVDEEALSQALTSGQIAGAGFNVVTSEPPAKDHVMMGLLDLPNFILTPHVAWSSREAIRSLVDQLKDNIESFVAGQPRNIV